MQRTIAILTGFLALLGIGAAAEHVFGAGHPNPGFYEHPGLMQVHVGLGALYLALALLQFSARVRDRWPALHRASGRLAVVAGLATGGTALVIAAWFPFSGLAELAVVAPFAALFLLSLARGLWLARSRRFAEHREWMIRALAVGTSIATMRLIFVPALLLIGPSDETARWLSLTSFGIAFVVHATAAEAWIRATREASPVAPFLLVRS